MLFSMYLVFHLYICIMYVEIFERMICANNKVADMNVIINTRFPPVNFLLLFLYFQN